MSIRSFCVCFAAFFLSAFSPLFVKSGTKNFSCSLCVERDVSALQQFLKQNATATFKQV